MRGSHYACFRARFKLCSDSFPGRNRAQNVSDGASFWTDPNCVGSVFLIGLNLRSGSFAVSGYSLSEGGMFQSPLAYFLTFSTYGTWLHGREPGSVDKSHNIFDTPTLPTNSRREQVIRSQMRQPEYVLDEPRRQCVRLAIQEVAHYRDWALHAAQVRTNHAHIVITTPSLKPEPVLMVLKAWSSRQLRLTFKEEPKRVRWTHDGSTEYLWDEAARARACKYVVYEQGEPMAVYPTEPNPDRIQPGT